MIDHWEVDGDLVTLEEELGEGAFGKVYKGILKEVTTPSRKLSMMPPINAIRKNTIKQSGGFTVAVKMLHGELHKLHCVLLRGRHDGKQKPIIEIVTISTYVCRNDLIAT